MKIERDIHLLCLFRGCARSRFPYRPMFASSRAICSIMFSHPGTFFNPFKICLLPLHCNDVNTWMGTWPECVVRKNPGMVLVGLCLSSSKSSNITISFNCCFTISIVWTIHHLNFKYFHCWFFLRLQYIKDNIKRQYFFCF